MSVTTQLCFPFVPADPLPAGPSRSTRYWMRRLRETAAKAFELGQRRARKPPRTPLPIRKFHPTHEERDELAVLARRVRNLTIDRRDPEWFHEEKSEVAHVLMQIAKRS